MATSKDKRWNFAYKIKDNTIYVYDACHSQNIHDNKKIIDTIVTEVINDIKRQLLALTK